MKNHTLAEDSFDVRRTRSQTSRPSPVLPLIAATLFAIHPVQGQVPQITAPPRSQTISAGSNLILGAATTGGNLSYQWRVNGANIPGQTNALLFLPQPTRTTRAATPSSSPTPPVPSPVPSQMSPSIRCQHHGRWSYGGPEAKVNRDRLISVAHIAG